MRAPDNSRAVLVVGTTGGGSCCSDSLDNGDIY